MVLEKLENYPEDTGIREVSRRKAETLGLLPVLLAVVLFLFMGVAEYVSAQVTNADGDLRLVNVDTDAVVDLGTVATPSGRLEIFDDPDGDGTGEWKGICDDGLGTLGIRNNIRVIGRQEARVACRQLGFSGGVPITKLALPSTGSVKPSEYYLLDELKCSGSEDRILGQDRCKHLTRGLSDCGAGEAFGVTCEAATSNTDAVGQIVISGTEPKTGVTLTADHSKITDADGKPTVDSAFSYQWIRVDKSFFETEISGATSSAYTLQETDEEEWVKVRVSFTDNAGNTEKLESFEYGPVYTNKPDGSLRLVVPVIIASNHRVTNSNKGRLQIFDEESKRWRGICDDNWDDTDAGVACRQLGYSAGKSDGGTVWYGYPRLLFLLDEVECDGTEDTVLECDHAGRGVHDCTSYEYAGVICE